MDLKQKLNLVINSLTDSLRSLLLRSRDLIVLFSKHPHTRLCYKCQALNIASLRNSNGFTHGTPSEILAAAKSDCPLCILLEKNFDLGPPSMPVRLHGIRRILPSNLSASPNVGDIESIRVLNGCDRDVDNPFSHTLALLTIADDLAAKSLLRRPFIANFATEECSRLIKSWLNKCILCHPNCTINSPVISRLPSRVIRVGAHDGLEPTLFTPPTGHEGAYVALSYCWGRRKNILLTKEMTKLPNMSVIFPISVLPKTLQDAIQIIRNLGFEFLWIDSLCIIQEGDDGEDLRRECITMHEVYGSATLTIAAAAAGSVHGGFFQCPKTNPKMQSDFIIKYDLDDCSLGIANIAMIVSMNHTRGWTFQERVLSPKTIWGGIVPRY
ncbi:uncharacterized protein EAE97_000810 [Botrytis byssoidea]|uniref:Heterokaryon incompatibility domain-containing protein n=1 Tax=Botrytis byssoidea TaxID=139641 RepID=A0A9P5IT85_9HELO|nr:uncharacterized protein EAE97_000810 [Botrytis byssoidea]KAF7953411.1 hypothetical protein EAE97_000810 [Botrytis byssoidea]